jgi:geranylgeranyl diphosphate synthase type II
VTEFGLDGARRLASESHERARTGLRGATGADTAELERITDFIATRSY